MKKHSRSIIIAILCSIILVGVVAYQFFKYTEYDVTAEYERNDSAGTQYEEFNGALIAYNTDGIYYGTPEGRLIWNQPYEYDFPRVEVSDKRGVVYNQGGRSLYLFGTEGINAEISTGMSISKATVSASGVTAVLLKEEAASYIQVYAGDGALVAEGQYYPENNGYPMDMALSDDGSIMIVSLLDISDRTLATNILFYNFGSVGQYESDNIVSKYRYEGLVVPEVTYFEGNRSAAFGTGMVIMYSGSQKPKQDKEIAYEEEMRSVIYNKKYFAVISVLNDPERDEPYLLDIYAANGRRTGKQELENEYMDAAFLKNNQVLLTDGSKCEIYSLLGVRKFEADTESAVYEVLGNANGRVYTFIQEDENRRIRIK